MTKVEFGLYLIVLGIAYGLKDSITNTINNTLSNMQIDFKLRSIYISYVLFIVFAFILVFGMLIKEKKHFNNVSSGFENVKPKDMNRPNPLFDIDTYW